MISLTDTERRALLLLCKDYSTHYNANSISKELGISNAGAFKMLRRFKEQGLTKTNRIGKSIIHKPVLKNEYNRKLISFLFADEANMHKRWKEEFRDLYAGQRIILIYGSALSNYRNAQDIDIMVVTEDKIDKALQGISALLPKKIHAIRLTRDDLEKNMNEKNKAVVHALKNAVVLYGEDEYVEVLKNVTVF
jgi:hypothetical protein